MKKNFHRAALLLLALSAPIEAFSCSKIWDPIVATAALGKYVLQRACSRSASAQQRPFAWPEELPAPAALGAMLKETVDKRRNRESFLFGASTSEHQCSMQCTPAICSWSRFAQERSLPEPSDISRMDWWHHYRSYIDYAHEQLHLNALRFSIEWAVVQPKGPEEYDQDAIKHYLDLFSYMAKKGITPIVTFHHYTDPCWFADRGGFEKEENINHFVSFCTTMYQSLAPASPNLIYLKHPPLWATFNSPTGYAFHAYHQGDHPPACKEKQTIQITMTVLKNMLEAHVRVYDALKKSHHAWERGSMYYVEEPRIGFLHNIHQLDAASSTFKQKLMRPISSIICSIAQLLNGDALYRFFINGKFQIQIPGVCNINHTNIHAPFSFDFVGLNYYSNRNVVGKNRVPTPEDTDNENYRIYPDGLYRAIVEIDQMARPRLKPIYVTENGIATTDEERRSSFYHHYLYALQRAIEDGYDVQGYLTWTLADNYEWPSASDREPGFKKYGLCTVDEYDSSRLCIKEGARVYQEIVTSFLSGS